ncbi:MAG: HDIG domain-containing protein [Verrucomicrobiae bacterium]|nr:HDIG domain-containing protein [Verrucomicrobiae bacterium]
MNMLSIFQRQKLVRQGLSCGKQRRRATEAEWRQWLETGPGWRLLLVGTAGAAFCLLSLARASDPGGWMAALLEAALVFAGSLLALPFLCPEAGARNSRVLLIYLVILIHLGVARGVVMFREESGMWVHLIPAAFAPMMLSVLLGPVAGVFGAATGTLLVAVAMGERFEAVATAGLFVGLLGVICTRRVRKRQHIIRAGLCCGAAGMVCALAFGLVEGVAAAEALRFAAWAAAVGLLTGFIVNAILPLFEWLFDITIDVTWLEMADLNHPLLQEMATRAPGTYHHSLVVANLAEAAAAAIGANSLQCRVACLFHDIGKLVKPEYFVENIGAGDNPHDELSPSMSALIVTSHVKEGVDLALKHKLNSRIVDAILEHHGTTLVSYFYARARQQQRDALEGVRILQLREDDVPEVQESTFRYPGPKPRSRETAILMLADAVEGASRSLEKPTAQRVEELVDSIVRKRIADGQLDDCPISLSDVQVVAERLAANLKTMMHGRIAYPKDDDERPAEKERGRRGPDQSSAALPVAPAKAAPAA